MVSLDDIKSTTLTLRFKHSRVTILLFVDPLTPFPSILKELLATLCERYPLGLPTSPDTYTPIPDSGLDVVLGVPKDAFDLEKGWEELDLTTAGLTDTPKSLGIKDGAQIAFAFAGREAREKGQFEVEVPNVAELYPNEE
ncbi:hypothetical protein QTJ16_004713 [Diplocarpon rosae]|uniref:Uncharacterized protein n=1 Tax=Diplocarpon rosae TaxID=946125 RepID=A0AAD9SX55_9HELO|nr:hypothetical protein QTJ16_004713 [Diplocarpon rosae]PBP18841.1 hypothetical protein BUE80_DR010486 [Diplocarpon rosae]